MFKAPLAVYGLEDNGEPVIVGGLDNGGGKADGGGTDEGGGKLDKPVDAIVGGGCKLGLWLGNKLTIDLVGIGLNKDVVSVVKFGWDCWNAASIWGLFDWSKNKLGLKGDAFLLNGCLVSFNFGNSLISADGVLLCCIGWKWLVDGGKTVNGWKLWNDALKLNASLIRLFLFCANLSI